MQRTKWLRYFRRSEVKRIRDQTSVEKQRDIVDTECRQRGITDFEDFIDAKGHRSGRHETTRPEWLRLKVRLNDPDVAGVIFYDFDRASRSVGHTAQLLEFCQAHSIAIISIYDRVDTTRGIGVSEIQRILMKAVFAQGESDIASQRMRESIEFRNAKGIYHGYPPEGTKPVGEGLSMRHVAHEPVASQVRQMLEWFSTGMSYRNVMLEAAAMGFKHRNRQGHDVPYTLAVVQSICNNVLFYAGYLPLKPGFSKDDKVTFEGEGSDLERYARYAQAIRSDRIEALIDERLADAVVRRRYERQIVGPHPRNNVALMVPVLWLGERRFYAQQRYGKVVYRLRGKQSKLFNADLIDGEMIKRLSGLKFPEAMRRVILELASEQSTDALKQQQQARVAQLKMKLGRVKDMYAEGIYTREEFDEEFKKATVELERIRQSLATRSEVATVMDHLTTLAETLKVIPSLRRRQAVCALLERVDIDEGGAIIRVRFREWAKHAFAEIASACLSSIHALDRT